MKSYHAVKAQIEKLEKQAESMRHTEIRKVVAEMKKTITEYGLTASDLGLAKGPGRRAGARQPRRAATVGVAKYRNPATGDTWTGHGRPPAWIAGAKDREAFLIDGPANSTKRKAASASKRTKAAGKRPRGKTATSAAATPGT